MTAGGPTRPRRVAGVLDPVPWLARRLPVFYGWVIVAVAALGLLCSGPGQAAVIATFMEPIIADLGFSRSAVSAAFTAGTLMAALAMGPVGRLTDRFGGQIVLGVGVAALGLTCLLMARLDGYIGLLLGLAALRMLIQGPLALTATTLVAQWFVRQRGTAQSLVALGITGSFAVVPIFTQGLIDGVGWRQAWFATGLLVWLVMLPPVVLLVRARPEDVGLTPDGSAGLGGAPGQVEVVGEEWAWTAGQAVRSPGFWLISVSIALTWLVGAGLNFHQVALLVSQGQSASFAAAIFTVAGIASLPATFLSGYLVDRLPARQMLIGMLIVQTLATWSLLWGEFPAVAVLYGALNGVMVGLSSVLNAVIFAAYFGRRHLGSIRGITMILNVGASALGALPLGLAYDLLGSFSPALIALGLLTSVPALALRWVGPPAPPPASGGAPQAPLA